jgi:diaminopimelate epimerase
MKIDFAKYQATGNDFVMLNNLDGKYDNLSIDQVKNACDRRFGIGADGLIKLNAHNQFAFEADYYNSDGSKSFCGNGARAAVAFAQSLGIIDQDVTFLAIDGVHRAWFEGTRIVVEMQDVTELNKIEDAYVLDTGSPHYVAFVNDLNQFSIVQKGREIRYSDLFAAEGINVNLVQQLSSDTLIIETYERGVEDETLSCGTGATACALAFAVINKLKGENTVNVKVKGGLLTIKFNQNSDGKFTDIRLSGPAEFVFKGEIAV